MKRSWQLLSKCRRHFSNFKRRERVSQHWRHSCGSNQPELRQLRQQRSALIQTLGAMRTDRGSSMVDTKGIGQPFMWKGTAGQDFGEWSHKVRTLMLARFGDQILTPLTWTAKDRCQYLRSFAERTLHSLDTVFGEQADEEERIDNIDDSMSTLSPSQPTHPTELFGTLEKDMAWKPGDDCTVITTPRRP